MLETVDFKKEFAEKKARFISHEIKNHLGIINLYTKLIEKNFGENENTKIIYNAVNDITNLLSELKNSPSINIEQVDLKNVFENAVFSIEKYIQDDEVSLTIDIEDNALVYVDRQKFQDVLLNLIKNAKEALSETIQENKYIRISTVKIGNKIHLRVENNGVKIEKESQNKLFEDGFTTKKEGSGIGLHLCKQYISEMGGELSLLKSDKKQTVFQIILPIIC